MPSVTVALSNLRVSHVGNGVERAKVSHNAIVDISLHTPAAV